MKTFKELYHAKIAWNQQSNIPSVEEAQIVELSKKDYDHAQKIINDPKTKGGNYGQAVKDLEKWKKGSTKDKKIAKMLYKAHNEQVHGYDDNPDAKKKNESVSEEVETVLEKAYDSNDVKKVQQLEKKLQGMLKEVEKTMKGSGLSAPAFNNVRSGISKGLESIQKFYKVANKVESVDDISEATKEIEVNWDMDDPREYQGDFQDVGVYLQSWDRKGASIIVQGDEKDLMNWLMSDFGMNKREAQQAVRKGKKV